MAISIQFYKYETTQCFCNPIPLIILAAYIRHSSGRWRASTWNKCFFHKLSTARPSKMKIITRTLRALRPSAALSDIVLALKGVSTYDFLLFRLFVVKGRWDQHRRLHIYKIFFHNLALHVPSRITGTPRVLRLSALLKGHCAVKITLISWKPRRRLLDNYFLSEYSNCTQAA